MWSLWRRQLLTGRVLGLELSLVAADSQVCRDATVPPGYHQSIASAPAAIIQCQASYVAATGQQRFVVCVPTRTHRKCRTVQPGHARNWRCRQRGKLDGAAVVCPWPKLQRCAVVLLWMLNRPTRMGKQREVQVCQPELLHAAHSTGAVSNGRRQRHNDRVCSGGSFVITTGHPILSCRPAGRDLQPLETAPVECAA